MIRLLALLVLAAAPVLLTSCASQAEDPNRVSTIPWNRPEKWEGQGPLGSMNPASYR